MKTGQDNPTEVKKKSQDRAMESETLFTHLEVPPNTKLKAVRYIKKTRCRSV